MNNTEPLATGTHVLEVAGVPLVYHVAGRGPVCVAHPGGPGIGWEYLRMPLAEKHLTMVYLEPVGTGASGRLDRSAYGRETYVRFLDALIEHLGAGPVVLLGHSYGGFVAQLYALAFPEKTAGLILYDTSPVTGPEFGAAADANLRAYPGKHPDVPEAALIPAAFARAKDSRTDAAFTEALREAMPVYFADYWKREPEFRVYRAGLVAWVDPELAPGSPFDVRDRLAEIHVPVLVLVGAEDWICGVPFALALDAGLPDSALVVLAHSGHLGHIEEPWEFAAAIESFAAGLAA